MASEKTLVDFVRESNRIEGIFERIRHLDHHGALIKLLSCEVLHVENLEDFVLAIQPGALLRISSGDNVRVADHVAPMGGAYIWKRLDEILAYAMDDSDAWETHNRYETLHPFTDGNGRSGRALWLWQMVKHEGWKPGNMPRLFLQQFYYQTLQHFVER